MSLRQLSGDFAFYGLLDLLQRSVSLIMVPLYTRSLSQTGYGALDMALILSSVGVVLVDLQFTSAFTRYYLEYEKTGRGPTFVGTLVITRFAAGTALVSTVWALGTVGWLEWSSIPSFKENSHAWANLLCLIPLTLIYDILLLQARMLRHKPAFAIGALGNVIFTAAFSLLIVTNFKTEISSILLAMVIGKLVGLLGLLVILWQQIRWRVDRHLLKPVLAYSLPLIPGWWMSFAGSYIGRFFVFGGQGAGEAAIMAVTTKLTGAIGLVAVSFRSAWLPLAMGYIGSSAGSDFYVRSMRLFMAGLLGATLLLTLLIGPILQIVAPASYSDAAVYFPIFAIAVLISECETSLQLGNQIAERTAFISVAAVLYLAVNLALLIFPMHADGVMAASIALAVAALSRALFTYYSAQRSWRIPYDSRAFLWFTLGCILFASLGVALVMNVISKTIAQVLIGMLAIVLPWLILKTNERRRAMAWLVK